MTSGEVPVAARGRALRRWWRLLWSWTLVWVASVPALVLVLLDPTTGAAPVPTAGVLPVGVVAGLLALSAAAAVAGCCLPWPLGRIGLPVAAGAAAGLSLAVDVLPIAALTGAGGWSGAVAVAWVVCEGPALVALAARVASRVPVVPAAGLTALVGVAAVLLPVRLTGGDLSLPAVVGIAVLVLLALSVVLVLAVCRRVVADRRRGGVVGERRDRWRDVALDLHGRLDHETTAVVREAQLARVEQVDPAASERIERAGRRALAVLDELAAALRAESRDPERRPDGVPDLPELARRFTAAGRARAEVVITRGVPAELPREVDAAIHHLVLEALTNVRRHAGPTVRVRIVVQPNGKDAVQVTVTDSGGGTGLPVRRAAGGTGLVELDRQVRAAGGQLGAGPHEHGWRVAAVLPTKPASPHRTGHQRSDHMIDKR